jgi:hypothetical protein
VTAAPIPVNVVVARVERFISRFQAANPGRNTFWSDCSDRAAALRVEDLQLLLVLVAAHGTETLR